MQPSYFEILNRPCAFWLAAMDESNIPDLVRCAGLGPLDQLPFIDCYVSDFFGAGMMKILRQRPSLALSAIHLIDFESYQYKGLCIDIRPCTAEEVERQRSYLEQFSALTAYFGFSAEAFFRSFFHQPSYTLRFHVHSVFEQTPRKGTGAKIINLEASL